MFSDIEKVFWLAVYIDTCGFLVLRAGDHMVADGLIKHFVIT